MTIDLTLIFLVLILLLIVFDICTDKDEGSLCQRVKEIKEQDKQKAKQTKKKVKS